MSETDRTTVHVNLPQESGGGLATAAMVIGIIALILSFIPVIGFISWILAPLAIIFGGISLYGAIQNNRAKGSAITGLVTGLVALFICMLWAASFGAAVAGAEEAARQAQAEDEAALQQLEDEMAADGN